MKRELAERNLDACILLLNKLKERVRNDNSRIWASEDDAVYARKPVSRTRLTVNDLLKEVEK